MANISERCEMTRFIQTLMDKPLFAVVAAAIMFTQLAIRGHDIRPLVSAMVDEIVPAIA